MKPQNVSCCGEECTFVTLSVNIQYWYCRQCKLEVDPESAAKKALEETRQKAMAELDAWVLNHFTTVDSVTYTPVIPTPRMTWY